MNNLQKVYIVLEFYINDPSYKEVKKVFLDRHKALERIEEWEKENKGVYDYIIQHSQIET